MPFVYQSLHDLFTIFVFGCIESTDTVVHECLKCYLPSAFVLCQHSTGLFWKALSLAIMLSNCYVHALKSLHGYYTVEVF